MIWVTISVCHTLLCPVCRRLKTAKAVWHFPEGWKKKTTSLLLLSAFHTRKTQQRGLAIVKCWALSPFSPWQANFKSVPLFYVSPQHLWQRKRRQPRIHDLLISDVFCHILVNIYSHILMCKTRIIIWMLALWAGIMGAHRSKDKGFFFNHLGNTCPGWHSIFVEFKEGQRTCHGTEQSVLSYPEKTVWGMERGSNAEKAR